MTTPQWRLADEGWGRRAVEVATLHEPQNVREYVATLSRLGVGPGTRLLDIACGAGLALELAAAMGATVAGIDASPRLVAVAKDRLPTMDIRVGDMRELPWDEGAFDVVTSFRGIWGTTPEVLDEVMRVLQPGGRLGLTVWGHIKASPGGWALRPFGWAEPPKLANQAAMNGLSKPGVGERVLTEHGFENVSRVALPFVWEFADPESYARSLATTGPAYESIQAVGEERFLADATALAREHVREGLPLRAEIDVTCFVATRPVPADGSTSFLREPAELDEAGSASYAEDEEELGYVMNLTRMWANLAGVQKGLFEVLGQATKAGGLSMRDRGILVTATASTFGDSYCSLAWGRKLADAADPGLSSAVLSGDDTPLDERERALARWARRVASDPNRTVAADVQALRAVGYDERQILAITSYIALRIAFSTVNDALGAAPDAQLRTTVPEPVRRSVTWGRPIMAPPTSS